MSENHIPGFRCPNCKWADLQSYVTCPRCGEVLERANFSAKGRLASYTIIRYPPAGTHAAIPYVIALVDLENGPRIIGRLDTQREDLEIGSPVRFVREVREGWDYLEFTPISTK